MYNTETNVPERYERKRKPLHMFGDPIGMLYLYVDRSVKAEIDKNKFNDSVKLRMETIGFTQSETDPLIFLADDFGGNNG